MINRQVQSIRQAMQTTVPDQLSREEDRADFDPNEASAAIGRLRILLESCDGDAAEAFLAVERALAGKVASSSLDALGTAISEFDFEVALLKLNELAQAADGKQKLQGSLPDTESFSRAGRLADPG